jgi:hypothetical protein
MVIKRKYCGYYLDKNIGIFKVVKGNNARFL